MKLSNTISRGSMRLLSIQNTLTVIIVISILQACAPSPSQYPKDREKADLKKELAMLQQEQEVLLEQMRILQEDLDSARRAPATGEAKEIKSSGFFGSKKKSITKASIADQIIASQQYQNAFAAFSTTAYEEAEMQFASFAAKYPDNKFAGNALFWRAQSLLALGRTVEGSEELIRVVEFYPTSGKAPESLVMLADIYRNNELTEQAIETEETLRLLYPYSNAARRIGSRATAPRE